MGQKSSELFLLASLATFLFFSLTALAQKDAGRSPAVVPIRDVPLPPGEKIDQGRSPSTKKKGLMDGIFLKETEGRFSSVPLVFALFLLLIPVAIWQGITMMEGRLESVREERERSRSNVVYLKNQNLSSEQNHQDSYESDDDDLSEAS